MFDEVVKYIGCIGVKTSMRTMCHRTRSDVAKESINRLCRANKIPRRSDSRADVDFERMLDNEPNLLYSGTDVQLCVTPTHLNVISEENRQIIIQHEMPNVSFASQGDGETVDFVAYVAKDSKFGRACFVLDCGYRSGKNVLDKIARGFEMRTKQILYNKNTSLTDGFKFHSTDMHDTTLEASYKTNNENDCMKSIIAETRASLEKQPWYHGSHLSREESERRLEQDGDFLVRESILDPGHFVLSVKHNGTNLHLLFDSMNQVKTKEKVFKDINHLIRYHRDEGWPIVAENRIIYLRNGVCSSSNSKPIIS